MKTAKNAKRVTKRDINCSSDLIQPKAAEERRRFCQELNLEFDAPEHHCASVVQPTVSQEE